MNRSHTKRNSKAEDPIPDIYDPIDNDLARDNIESDLPESDKIDIQNRFARKHDKIKKPFA